jgi:hypothetical protein
MKPLQISVSFFSTIVITCYYTHNSYYHHLYTLMLLFGLLNHELDRNKDNSKNVIHIVDIFLANLAFISILYDTYTNPFMCFGLVNTFILYICEYMYPRYAELFHMMIHFYTVFFMNFYFILIQNNTISI